ncbi:site-specific integrase [Planctomycetota bacterium]
MKSKDYCPTTEKTYSRWAERFLDYHEAKQPDTLAANDIQLFLKYLASERRASVATQRQALTALVFLYEHVLNKDLKGEHRALLKSLPPLVRHERRNK